MFAQFAVYLELFGGKFGDHLVVAAAVGFGYEGADLALAALELAMREGVEGVFHLIGHGLRVGRDGGGVFVLEGASKEDVTLLVGRGVEEVGWGGRVGESL